MTRISDAELRRQGMADACVLLVAKRFVATVDLEDWGRVLELTDVELQHAVERFKSRLPGFDRKPPDRMRAEQDRQRVLHALRTLGGIVADPGGHASAVLRYYAALDVDSVRFAAVLKDLEDSGAIRREVRGRRTFRIELAAHEHDAVAS